MESPPNMRTLALILLLCALFLLVSCGSSNSPVTGTDVAACDEYISMLERCADNPNTTEEAKSAYKRSLAKSREDFKRVASTPEGRAVLEKQCKALSEAQKSFMDKCR